MKSMIVSTICALFLSLPLQSQVCASLTLSNQAEVDAVNCMSVTGDVIISGLNITNLDGLSSITSIGGKLDIIDNASLENVNGLSQLGSIGGSLTFYANPVLENVDSLSQLGSIGAFLTIVSNDMLSNIDGFSQLGSIGGSLVIGSNGTLSNIDGLLQLESIGGVLQIENNPALENIDGLSQLESIGGDLDIRNNVMLDRYCGLYTVLSAPTPEGLIGSFTISGNFTNPTEQEILDLGAACPVVPDVEIPTIGEWGLAIVGLFIVIFGVIGIRRREVSYGV